MNLRNRKDSLVVNTSFLTTGEVKNARLVVIRLAQATAFATEINILKRKDELPKRNPLRKLNPFVGEIDGVLRVGGRLTHSSQNHEAKHPPILPHHSTLNQLFIRYAYETTLHGGPTLTLSFLLQQVWILGRTRLVKTFIHKCVKCQRVKPSNASQLMGDLPRPRLVPSRPFSHSGLDYAGPVQLRATKGRGHRSYKGYIVLFVCFSSRAIHVEAVTDLTAVSFLTAFQRFVGRRGRCEHLYSDNGTTFQKAARELGEMFKAASNFYKEVATVLANEGTDWTFIPPNSPHCGGIWEAGIISTKHHLKRAIGDHRLTFEELCTLLIEIEACLNSRPLSPLTNDIDDLSALTPAHFLIGGCLGILPEAGVPTIPENRLNRFQLLQHMRDGFWKR